MRHKIILAWLLFICICLTGCSNKMSEKEIKNMLEINTGEKTFKVNKVLYATDNITINGIKIQVKDNTVTLGDYSTHPNSEKYKQITGYYDQSAAIYNIYMLSEDINGKNTIWKMKKNKTESFKAASWEKQSISNVSNLILIDCEETLESFGQTPLKYQVYALVNDELVLID